MPQIIPIRDLKNTSQISEICHSSNEPVFVTKNGYGDMVIMSISILCLIAMLLYWIINLIEVKGKELVN